MSHPSHPRLHVTQPLAAGAEVTLADKQAHYLLQVMRLKAGDAAVLFNGIDGEWQATVGVATKKSVTLRAEKILRPQVAGSDIWLLCAPVKGGRSEWVVEKATELGVMRIRPVRTQFTIVERINEARLAAIATEAAEQCE